MPKNGMAYFSSHIFMENGRCWHCQIKPSYLLDFIEAYRKGNYSEDDLRRMSACHGKVERETPQ